MATRSERTKDDEDIDEIDTDKTSPELLITKVRKRIFDNEVNDNDEKKTTMKTVTVADHG